MIGYWHKTSKILRIRPVSRLSYKFRPA